MQTYEMCNFAGPRYEFPVPVQPAKIAFEPRIKSSNAVRPSAPTEFSFIGADQKDCTASSIWTELCHAEYKGKQREIVGPRGCDVSQLKQVHDEHDEQDEQDEQDDHDDHDKQGEQNEDDEHDEQDKQDEHDEHEELQYSSFRCLGLKIIKLVDSNQAPTIKDIRIWIWNWKFAENTERKKKQNQRRKKVAKALNGQRYPCPA